MFHPTHETQLLPGLRSGKGPWRVMCTFLEVRFPTAAEATAWADRQMDAATREHFRGGATPVPNLIQPVEG